jgi:hypothetical protein
MHTRSIVAGAALALVCVVGALTAEWEETDWGSNVVLDYKTGLPAVVFHVTLEYTSASDSYHLSTSWDVFAIVDGSEVPLDGFSRSSIRSGDVRRVYSASPPVLIESGRQYGARVTIADSVHDLSYERIFEFLAPPTLPFGIRLSGWDGSEEIDLSELPDEELEELVLLHELLDGYSRATDDVSLEAFLLGDAAASAYPLSLLLLPSLDIDTSGTPLRIFVVLSLYVYTLSGPSDVAGLLDQLEQFMQEFIGDVYAGAGSAILGGGKTVFVHHVVRSILEAAVVEQENR